CKSCVGALCDRRRYRRAACPWQWLHDADWRRAFYRLSHHINKDSMGVNSGRRSGKVRLQKRTHLIGDAVMEAATFQPHTSTAIRTDLYAIFVSLEFSKSTWLITSLSPGNGEKMSKHSVIGGDVTALLDRFA